MILLYLTSIALLAIGGLLTVMNANILFRQLCRKPSPSIVPVLGGIFLFSGSFLFPGGLLRPWAVLGLFFDYGCMPYTVLVSVHMIAENRRYAPKNRILSLHYNAKGTTGNIFVYPSGECLYEYAAQNGKRRGSFIMKVDCFTPGLKLIVSIQETEIEFRKESGAWLLWNEVGWRDPVHSLVGAIITETAANKAIQSDGSFANDN